MTELDPLVRWRSQTSLAFLKGHVNSPCPKRSQIIARYMGVSKNRGTPKWMVRIMENPMNKWMIWGENPLFSETSTWVSYGKMQRQDTLRRSSRRSFWCHWYPEMKQSRGTFLGEVNYPRKIQHTPRAHPKL